jgi:Asp-tRNA(Asn)/Glu-tRNA(Gln) amidotransferase A subunit family amidase
MVFNLWRLTFVAIFVFLIGCTKTKNLESINLDELTIAQIHQAYVSNTFNAVQLTQAYLTRIDSLNPKINALTTINSQALAIASELDAEFKRTGKLRPLHGIPIIVKDNFNTKNMPTTAGSLALQNFISDDDAFIIAKLVEAGAIIIAKSNMAEWAFSPRHTESSTAGTTKNPYNLNYVPAGSSGGTAAAIASNIGVLGMGTDTGNSIRGPSAHTSLVGFRSTVGLTSRSGIVPLYLRNDVGGPMCRTVEDATKVLEVIAAIDTLDPVTFYADGKIPENYTQFLKTDGLKNARVGVLRILSNNNPDSEVTALFEQALDDMQLLGAQIIDSVAIPNFNELSQNQWCAEFRQDIETYLKTYVKNDTLQKLEDIIRIGTKSTYAKNSLNYFLTASGRAVNPEINCENPFLDKRRIAFREAIEKVMDDQNLDALVYPSWNNKPAKIELFNEEYKGDNSQIIAPHTGQPAFTVPMGFTSNNLPAGIQFLGRMFDEPTLIKLTYSYEQGTKHRKPPILN